MMGAKPTWGLGFPMKGAMCPGFTNSAGAPFVSDTRGTSMGTARSTGAFTIGERKGFLKAALGLLNAPGLLKGALTPTAGLTTTVLVDLGDSGATRAGSSSSAMSSAPPHTGCWHPEISSESFKFRKFGISVLKEIATTRSHDASLSSPHRHHAAQERQAQA